MSNPAGWSVPACRNLSLEERIADRVEAILFAAGEIRDMIALADAIAGEPPAEFDRVAERIYELVHPLLPFLTTFSAPNVERDPELEAAMLRLEAEMSRLLDRRSGLQTDEAWDRLDTSAAPYALAFFFEIRRLDHLYLVASIANREPSQRT